MQFLVAYPWWVLVLIAVAAVLVALGTYAGPGPWLTQPRRAALIALRAVTLLLLVWSLLGPVRAVPPAAPDEAIVPVLIDVSRSMRLPDERGRPRIDTARDLWRQLPLALEPHVRPEAWSFGASLDAVGDDRIEAASPRSDLASALRALRERYPQRPPRAIVVISDGGETGTADPAVVAADGSIPVFAVGVGARRLPFDLEVLDVSAGDRTLADSAVDVTVSTVSRGSTAPFDIRLLENGRPVELRHMTPTADGGPVQTVFTVAPAGGAATVYTVEIPSAAGELVTENNRRSVVVEPPGRRRRLLMIEGAPGFEHSYLKRALAVDTGLEVDSVVRKGRDERGAATYFVQASKSRASRLASGFPQERAALYAYDAVLLANVEGDALSRPQLQMIADFVDRRGGGLLVLGAKSFAQQGFAATPLEEVLPMRLVGRGGGVVRASEAGNRPGVTLTADGQAHPVMRIGGLDAMADRWRSMPALPGVAALGSLRPGAQALALVNAPDGPRPLLAVQRYGQGRALVFAGEASWRWRMQLPSDDRTYELFWRQAARWVSGGSPDPVAVVPVSSLVPGTTVAFSVAVRDEEFTPVADGDVRLRVTSPDGGVQELTATLADAAAGRYDGKLLVEEPGVYRVSATARRGGHLIGTSERWMLAGGADLEMANPRLNDEVLRRMAAASGGAYLDADEAEHLVSLLSAIVTEPAIPRLEPLWHNVWVLTALMLLLSSEWMLRRRWGMR